MGVVSNALPFQFWAIGDKTYNESQFGFVRSKPFIHEWQSGDMIKLQVGYEYDPSVSYSLKAKDRNGNIIAIVPYTKTVLTSYNEFDLSFSVNSFGGQDLVPYEYVQFFIMTGEGGTLDDLTFDSDTLDTYGDDSNDLYKTDFHRFRSLIPITPYSGSKAIGYKSLGNFASLNYPNDGSFFTLRIPCKFFTEREQIVQSSINLTSKIIDTAEFIKYQRWLQIPVMPDYMLKKIGLVLGHSVKGQVIIDGLLWSKQEAINRSGPGGDIKYPEQMADVWLTEKDNGVRNII